MDYHHQALKCFEHLNHVNFNYILIVFQLYFLAPGGPPIKIIAQRIPPDIIALSWLEPEQPNGRILSYQIYIRENIYSQQYQQQIERVTLALPPTLIRLLVEPNEKSKLFAYNITKLGKIIKLIFFFLIFYI